MAIEDFGLSADGYTAPRQSDYLTVIKNSYNTSLTELGFTELPDYERDVFLGNTVEIMSYLLGLLSDGTQAIYDARSVGNSTGIQLGNLAMMVGVPRDPATYGTVTLTCTGTDGTPITAPSNFCRLCSEIIRKTEKGCENCYKSDAALGKLCLDGPTIQPCMSGGLWDAGAGISAESGVPTFRGEQGLWKKF